MVPGQDRMAPDVSGEKDRPVATLIIPVYQEGERISACLAWLSTVARIDDAEVIVVDGGKGSTVRFVDTEQYPFPVKTVVTRPGRGHQLHTGAQMASSGILVFLHVGTTIRRAALVEILQMLDSHEAGAFDLYVRSRSYYVKTVAAFATIRSHLTRIPYGDQVHFIRTDTYRAIGGYRDMPIMEDVELMGRLKHLGHRIKFASTFAVNPDRRWRKEGGEPHSGD